ncbi:MULTISPECIES: ABC transporter ATP-binding protein [Sphingobium]|uniref:ABC transporter ATP-binding protein n=1 Tax=Sphingobium TaxID=165695 RepID=UPI001BE6F544|nr:MULTISPECIES: ABC transporter ATP-binding protein [Sphingobium]MBT2246362.1 ABC transporter ATP-binding protein [Sphingobium sp. BHU LFT2]WBQ19234.1 ABC transporter ATP-binding protein [Sphingobium yanoikuyae]
MVTTLDAAFDLGLSIQTRSVGHWFDTKDGRLDVLEDVTLDVAPGEFVALLGPSGCGKSTLLRLIAGLDAPRAGKVGADKVRIVGPAPSRLLVFQDPTLYPWRTVRQNVALGLEATGQVKGSQERIDQALDLVGLRDFATALPNELSGGMAQRAALARVLVNNPRLLLLDEPLGKLDSLTRMTLQAELVRLWQDARFTTLLVTHDVEEALLLAERIIIFSPRPARIVREIRVNASYPRHRDAPALQALRREILVSLGHDHEL